MYSKSPTDHNYQRSNHREHENTTDKLLLPLVWEVSEYQTEGRKYSRLQKLGSNSLHDRKYDGSVHLLVWGKRESTKQYRK